MRFLSSERRSVRGIATLSAALAIVLAVTACGGSKKSSTAPGSTKTTSSVARGGSLTFALDEDLAGFNILNASQSEFVLQEVLDQVWPSVFIVQPSLKPVLDKNVVTSATLKKKNAQTVVSTINPEAKWPVGVPINAADFIYNWQAQSGSPKFKDRGGK